MNVNVITAANCIVTNLKRKTHKTNVTVSEAATELYVFCDVRVKLPFLRLQNKQDSPFLATTAGIPMQL
jgi:hypothetical protein